MIKQFYCYLQEKPWIGMASGGGSGFLGTIYHFMTDDIILKIVSSAGIWIGFIVALVTGIGKIREQIKTKKQYEKVNAIPGEALGENQKPVL
jgi:hypothetical protein